MHDILLARLLFLHLLIHLILNFLLPFSNQRQLLLCIHYALILILLDNIELLFKLTHLFVKGFSLGFKPVSEFDLILLDRALCQQNFVEERLLLLNLLADDCKVLSSKLKKHIQLKFSELFVLSLLLFSIIFSHDLILLLDPIFDHLFDLAW